MIAPTRRTPLIEINNNLVKNTHRNETIITCYLDYIFTLHILFFILLFFFTSLSPREPGMLNMSRKRRWFSIPGKNLRTPWGRFLRLKLPPYRFHFKKYSDPPRGWDSFFLKNGVGTRFFDLQSLAVLRVGQVGVRLWYTTVHATRHLRVASHVNPGQIVLGQLCST